MPGEPVKMGTLWPQHPELPRRTAAPTRQLRHSPITGLPTTALMFPASHHSPNKMPKKPVNCPPTIAFHRQAGMR
ncbi:hypothetical protein E2C01_055609 [Portunus trituberculatus]|uniref:Uncharacterized protein n=1 Tax=Portunus trituberculatus TaxID=210409 RepID=A0A5B7GV92_PORTR|nr:hypothetical protein [Portunus trituberculatus]